MPRDPYKNWSNELAAYFRGRDMSAAAYDRAIETLNIGDEVSGKVICRAHFGAWIDIGIGFPALLEIIQIDGLKPSDYRAGNWCPVNSDVVATIAAFSCDARQIRLTQKPESTAS